MAGMKRIQGPPEQVRGIAKWIRECVYLIGEDGSMFTRIVVRHLTGAKRGDEVFFRNIPKKLKDQWADSAAMDIFTSLNAEAHSLGGLQKYALYAFSNADNENHFSRHVLRIQGGDTDEDEDGLGSEQPTDRKALQAQSWRHIEVLMKTHVSAQMTIVSAYQSLVQTLSSQNTELLEARKRDFEVIESALSHQSEREIEQMKAKTRAEAMRAVGDKLGLFLPAMLNRVAGKNLFPVEANAVMMMAKGLFTSLAADETKMQQLMSILGPEQQIVFFNLLEEVSKNVGENGLPTDDKTNGVNGEVVSP